MQSSWPKAVTNIAAPAYRGFPIFIPSNNVIFLYKTLAQNREKKPVL